MELTDELQKTSANFDSVRKEQQQTFDICNF